MGLTQVIGEVRRDGESRAEAILAAARKEAEAILDGARRQAKDLEAARLADAERQARQLASQLASRAESDARKAVLAAEAGLRAELKAAILKALRDAPAKSRQAHLKSLVARAQAAIPAGKAWGAAADAEALQKAKPYAYAGTAPLAGGILVESESGDARLDLSYETLLEEAWRDILRSEAALLA